MWPKTCHPRPRTTLQLETLEDRTAPAVVAASLASAPLATTNSILPQELLSPTVASTAALAGNTLGTLPVASILGTTSLLGTVGATSVANPFATTLGAVSVPNAIGAASVPTGAIAAGQIPAASVPQTISLAAPSVSSGLGVAASTTFNFASLPGGPVNSTSGGGVGVLGSGAMVTNGTAGLPPGGVINAPALGSFSGNDALFSIQGLAVRSLFPATLAVGGNAGQSPLGLSSGLIAGLGSIQEGAVPPKQNPIVPASYSPDQPEPDSPPDDLFFESDVS